MWIYLLVTILTFVAGWRLGRRREYHGPNSATVVDQIYQDEEGNCWKFVPEVVICPLDTSIIALEQEVERV